MRTKLVPPAVRRELVPRTRLVRRLDEAVERKLTLLSAPAGSGKTTLLGAWAESRRGEDVAWLSLDAGDADPIRFWLYLLEALRTAEPELGAPALALLRAPGTTLDGDVVPALVADAAALERRLVLVLDDYHLVESPEVHRSLELLLDRLPATLALVVASRADPPIALARLRARGELAELRAQHLRFDEEEAARFLLDALGLELDRADVARLHERTEGWAAGLYLAALSLPGQDAHDFVESFAGDDRHVVDYLVDEVLDRQPEPMRRFLLRTSILDRFCAPLCDALVGAGDAAETLVALERSNLFLVPLDTRRQWYRYHHLFGQLLRQTLHRAEPAAVPELHRSASAWFRDAGLPTEAIEHALAAGDTAAAAELLALHWSPFVQAGLHGTVERWLRTLPEEVVRGDARLCLAFAWALVLLGRKEEAVPWVDALERAPLPAPFADGTTSPESGVALLRAVHLGLERGDLRAAHAMYERAAALEAPSSPWRSVVGCGLGDVLVWLGAEDAAERVFRDTEAHGRATGMRSTEIYAMGRLALMAGERGEWEESEEIAQRALRLAAEYGIAEHWVAANAHVSAARCLARAGRREERTLALERALELASRGAGPFDTIATMVELAAARHEDGDRAAARRLVEEARRRLEACADPGELVPLLVERAERAVRSAPPRPVGPAEPVSERELDVLRLLAAGRSLREIASLLYVSHNTVKTHTRRVYRKLGASSRLEAVARARELRLI